MILSLTLTNWMSFQNETKWRLVASKERTNRHRIPKSKNLSVSPIAVIYGPNASGKSNLIKALQFIKQLVLKGPADITEKDTGVRPYALSGIDYQFPTIFLLDILVNNTVYSYNISMTRQRIIEEALSVVRSNTTIQLYHRKWIEEKSEYTFDVNPRNNNPISVTPIKTQIEMAKRTHPLRLFLTKSIEENMLDYHPLIEWFESLLIIDDNPIFQGLEALMEDTSLLQKVGKWLAALDTGIVRLEKKKSVVTEWIKNLPDEAKDSGIQLDPFTIARTQEGEFSASELVAYHQDDAGDEVAFPSSWLSTGSQKLTKFLPAFIRLLSKPRVLVVDELGRSWHHEVTRSLLEGYLTACNLDTRSQLIFTTNDRSLMTKDLFRLDELWVIEKNKNQSTLYSLMAFKRLTAKTNITKRYRQGHLGGLPALHV